jgi:hypothetical protein
MGQIFAFLFVMTFGAYLLRFIFGLGSDTPAPVDSLKGASSAVELSSRIDKAINFAGETGMLARDHQKVLIFLFLPPAGVLISIGAFVGFYRYEKRHTEFIPFFTRCIPVAISAVCFTSTVSTGVMALRGNWILSERIVHLCENENTEPSLVRPGDLVRVDFRAYSPMIKSIRSENSLSSVILSSLQYEKASGGAGTVDYSSLQGKDVGSPSEWHEFNRVWPEETAIPRLELRLPIRPELQGSLVSADVQGDLRYPAWVELDKYDILTTAIKGHISFWVADTRQAEFVAAAKRSREWEDFASGQFVFAVMLSFFALLVCTGYYMLQYPQDHKQNAQ